MIYNLAAFNGGPYITPEWKDLSGNDPDLFLEVIRYDQPRDYIRGITEYHEIYKTVYSRK
jgi:soluble lytic murein transglycosylase